MRLSIYWWNVKGNHFLVGCFLWIVFFLSGILCASGKVFGACNYGHNIVCICMVGVNGSVEIFLNILVLCSCTWVFYLVVCIFLCWKTVVYCYFRVQLLIRVCCSRCWMCLVVFGYICYFWCLYCQQLLRIIFAMIGERGSPMERPSFRV